MNLHTDKRYEEGLQSLKELILKMGEVVEEMIALAMKSLVDRNSNLVQEVIQRDPEVNDLEIAIDDRCLELLALHQPAASDLRFITIGLKISKDLERIGDLSVNIVENALEINKEPALKPYIDLPKMASKSQTMVKDSLDAFVKRDILQAERVCKVDDEVDDLNDRIFGELVAIMKKDPESISRSTRLISIAKHLERIADHATNIAEEIIFMVKGKDIRHGKISFEE
ncbi:MAG: phosphate transport system regulatory protein PhoU [Deltaproteobacteria bacterium RIFCSPLOWO2_01_44_7]|nr:MAG: phosphate transport system regulatory protein PhoU [Deltaproteobacteria bacterium RIFCSPHIGHO2_01_FULL_43_49]OGQ14706.1 MAG: phosphate transport system regulatory protein PhoU [Deltaproteobacteria bacterium RIFCSPHIGHO2_02_FULL_44_53]OGQ28092.1 MAG: phosphate transport system regulatory protein PhoU [Deltaproteobacteria bacterium RIFCSPHIGHO2_12_FULL_44_21]OGQ31304.1 MAG: phosphate transport system regulatory protein PhoU [Deltaproteobacteria bacterium RIFCSPLOWO2_01_FULL_45_74]OGQ38867